MSEESQKTLSWETARVLAFHPGSHSPHRCFQRPSAGPPRGGIISPRSCRALWLAQPPTTSTTSIRSPSSRARRKTSLSSGAVTALRTAQIECISGTACGSPGKALGARLQQLGKPHHPKIYPPIGQRAAEGSAFPFLGLSIWEQCSLFGRIYTEVSPLQRQSGSCLDQDRSRSRP